jgi:hypothetical protein
MSFKELVGKYYAVLNGYIKPLYYEIGRRYSNKINL